MAARLNDHPDDLPLDAELRQALSVDPSPEFEARVRQRVADARTTPSIGFGGRLAVAAVPTAAAVLAAVWLIRPTPEPTAALLSSRTVSPLGHTIASQSDLGTPPEVTTPRNSFPQPSGNHTQPVSRSPAASVSMELLIPAYERRALDAVLAALTEQRLDTSTIATTQRPIDDTVAIASLETLRSIEVPPINPVGQ